MKPITTKRSFTRMTLNRICSGLAAVAVGMGRTEFLADILGQEWTKFGMRRRAMDRACRHYNGGPA